jgi:hypothetical protein
MMAIVTTMATTPLLHFIESLTHPPPREATS